MSALTRFRAWIAGAMEHDDDRGMPIAQTVQWVSLAFGAGSVVALLIAFDAPPAHVQRRVIVSLGCVLLNALAFALVRWNLATAGAVVLVTSCWSSLMYALVTNGGLSIAGQSGVVVAICAAGLLLGGRAAFFLAALSTLGGPLSSEHPFHSLWLTQGAIFFSAAALVAIVAAHAQRALTRALRSESRFRALADNMQDVIIELDGERIAYANKAFLDRRRAIKGMSADYLRSVVHPDDLARVTQELARVRETGLSTRFSTRIFNPEGGITVADVSVGEIVDTDGRRRLVSVSRDVTAERAIEDALRDSEERYRMLAEHAPDMITEFDESGRMIYANRAAKGRGMHPEKMLDTPFGRWNHPEDVQKAVDAFNQTMATGRVTRLVHRALQKDGSYRWMASSGAAFRTSKGQMRLVAQSRDISEEIELQEQLRQAQKMEAIGRLAGGVAHDFNNLLTVIGGYADVLNVSSTDPSTQEAAREIGAAAQRASGLTRQLLALSRRQLSKSQVVDLNEQIRGLEPVLRRTLPESIELELVLDPALPAVQADPSQLDQVLLNLALNARDAMPTRGRLRIETRRDAGGHSLQMLVSDTGGGMDETTRLRAFEPFFTTKSAGAHSGLGLSTTYGIVQQAGGMITLESAPGCGTRVAIELPAAQQPATGVTARSGGPIASPERGTKVLLIEDDPSVRRLLTLLLQSSGYHVCAAASGDEALRMADAGQLSAVELVLSDYVLPGISGVETCVELRRRRPELRFVVMTGHAEIPPAGAAALPEGAELLGKPFSREQLEETLARQLS